MKNPQKTFNNNRLLCVLALLLVSKGTLSQISASSVTISSSFGPDIALSPCSSSQELTDLSPQLFTAAPYLEDYMRDIYLFLASGSASPTCFQYSLFGGCCVPGSLNGFSMTTIGESLRANTRVSFPINNVPTYTFLPLSDSTTPILAQVQQDLGRLTSNISGMALFLINNVNANYLHYYFHHFGSYRSSCHGSCSTCSGTSENQCTACSSFAKVVGSDVHASFAGRCFCETG